jgi:hypothetical protein
MASDTANSSPIASSTIFPSFHPNPNWDDTPPNRSENRAAQEAVSWVSSRAIQMMQRRKFCSKFIRWGNRHRKASLDHARRI